MLERFLSLQAYVSCWNEDCSPTSNFDFYDKCEVFASVMDNIRKFVRVISGVVLVLRELEVLSRWAEGDTYVTLAYIPFWYQVLCSRLADGGPVDVFLVSLSSNVESPPRFSEKYFA